MFALLRSMGARFASPLPRQMLFRTALQARPTHQRSLAEIRGMKTRTSVKKMCNECYVSFSPTHCHWTMLQPDLFQCRSILLPQWPLCFKNLVSNHFRHYYEEDMILNLSRFRSECIAKFPVNSLFRVTTSGHNVIESSSLRMWFLSDGTAAL
jgi:hypothetical protein